MQQQADAMLRECRIVETLEKYGEVFLHGSYRMGLMTRPEIDFWLLNDAFQSQQAWDIMGVHILIHYGILYHNA